MPITIFTPQMLRNGTRAVPEIPTGGGGGFTNTYSLDFDGVDDYVDTSSTKFSGASEFSISMWANFSAFSGNNPIVSNWFTGVTNYIIRYSSTKLQFYISTTGGVAKVTEYTFTPTLGIWYNIICVYNGSNISIYLNGTQQGTPTAITGTVLVNTNNCLIAERGTEHFNGLVDEVSYFDRVVTPTEIVTLSTAPTVDLTDLNPIAWYRNGDNGSWKSPQWLIPSNENKDKVSNYSFDFDGVDDFVSTNSKIIGSDITLSGWVNFNGSYSAFSAHFPLSITPSNLSVSNETLGRFYKNGSTLQIAIQCNDNTGGNFSTYFVDNITLEGAGWQHICLTYNVTTGHIYAYLNGVAQNWIKIFAASTPVPFLTAVSGRIYESDLTIGRYKPTTSTGTFLGLVDEVSTYNKILTQSEITSISSTPTDLTDLNPLAWYRMGEEATFSGGVWTVPDAAGSNNGTSSNMTIEDRVGKAPNSENNALSYNMEEVDRVEDVPS